MIGQLLLRLVLVIAKFTLKDRPIVMHKRMRRQLTTSVESFWALVAMIRDSTIGWLVNRLDMSLQILLISFSFTAVFTLVRLVRGSLRVSIDHVTLKSFLEHNYLTDGTLDVHLVERMN